GLRGNPSALRQFGQQLSRVSTVVAQETARDAAPPLTSLAVQAFDSGQTVSDDSRPRGAVGLALTPNRTGAARADLQFRATGTVVRCVLGPDYTRYLIGKYSILPNGVIPVRWGESLANIARKHFGESLG